MDYMLDLLKSADRTDRIYLLGKWCAEHGLYYVDYYNRELEAGKNHEVIIKTRSGPFTERQRRTNGLVFNIDTMELMWEPH